MAGPTSPSSQHPKGESAWHSEIFGRKTVSAWAFFFATFAGVTGTDAEGVTRHYYIAAEEVDWDFAPLGREMMMGREFTEDQEVFVEAGADRVGSVFKMARYVGYTDATLTTTLGDVDPSNGILGLMLHAEVGDRIEIDFRNNTTVPTSLHPHGVFYDKASEGSMTNVQAGMAATGDDAVPPCGTWTYI